MWRSHVQLLRSSACRLCARKHAEAGGGNSGCHGDAGPSCASIGCEKRGMHIAWHGEEELSKHLQGVLSCWLFFFFLLSCLLTAGCKVARAAQVLRVARLRRESKLTVAISASAGASEWLSDVREELQDG